MSRRVCSSSSSRLPARLLERLALGDLGRLARAGDDLVGLRARLAQALAVLGEQLVGLGSRALGACSIDSSIALLALVERLLDAREGDLRRIRKRDQEGEQRPDHQPDVGRDEEVAALLLGGRIVAAA